MLLTVLRRWSWRCSFSVWLCKVFPCSLSLCFVIPFSIVITSLGEVGAGLCASRAFVCLLFLYVLVYIIVLFLLVSGVGCGL